MKRKIQILVGGVGIILLAFAYAHISKTYCIYNTEADTSEYLSTAAVLNEEISQSFVSNEDSLDGVRVKIRLTGETSSVDTLYKLIDLDSNNVVAEGSVESKEFEDSKFYEFEFKTVESTMDKKYKFVILNQGESSGNSVDFCFETNTERDTNLTINNNEQEGTLILKTVTNRFDLETFCVLLIFIIYILLFLKFLYNLFK